MLSNLVTDCVAIVRTTPNAVFVIPDFIRNPMLFQGVMLLDDGSGPEWQAEFKRFFELRRGLVMELLVN